HVLFCFNSILWRSVVGHITHRGPPADCKLLEYLRRIVQMGVMRRMREQEEKGEELREDWCCECGIEECHHHPKVRLAS
ncbi:hypothetical protein KJ766_02620, partial [Patescibacteria group bacterium]|nr:hypothetical protein [Patescibacteria group bacterium]